MACNSFNMVMTPQERKTLKDEARANGFKSIAGFLRHLIWQKEKERKEEKQAAPELAVN